MVRPKKARVRNNVRDLLNETGLLFVVIALAV